MKKLASKEVNAILNPKGDHGEGDASEDESGKPKKSKSKGPNLTRLLKSRLSKLVAKTDAEYVPPTAPKFASPHTIVVTVDEFFQMNLWIFP